MTHAPRRRLDSWKEIADYLGRNVRTVSRWERERGLPVHGVPGGKGRSVFAFTDELDEWLSRGGATSQPETAAHIDVPAPPVPLGELLPSKRWRRSYGVAAAVLALITLIGWTVVLRKPRTAELFIDGAELVAVAADGREAWRFAPARIAPSTPPVSEWSVVEDLLAGDGPEVVTAPPVLPHDEPLLYLVSNDGQELWRRGFGETFTFADTPFGPPWQSVTVSTFPARAERRIGWVLHHMTWDPAVIAAFGVDGTPKGRFVHPGWISALEPTRDGRWLVAAGLSNAHKALAVVVLDPLDLTGTTPNDHGVARSQCRDCPAGLPERWIILPRPDAAVAAHPDNLTPDGLQPLMRVLPTGEIEVSMVFERVSGPPQVIYRLAPDFTLEDARVSDGYWDWHRRFETSGALTHSADDCPERAGLVGRVWTESHGWELLRPMSSTAAAVSH
jgi:hypothetical protein